MENQTRFDLNRALIAWKQELSAQPGVSPDNVRELQSHLLQCFDGFKQRGLGDEEAFAKARRQLGSAEEVGAEFARANPARIWRDRVFWMAFGGLILRICGMALASIFFKVPYRPSAVWAVVVNGPVLLLAACLATGRLRPNFRKLSWFFESRRRFAIGLLLLVLAGYVPQTLFMGTPMRVDSVASFFGYLALSSQQVVWPLTLAGLLVWLFPEQKRIAEAPLKMEMDASPLERVQAWRERIFWIGIAMLIAMAWQTAHWAGWQMILPDKINTSLPFLWLSAALWPIMSAAPLLWLAIHAARGGFATMKFRGGRWQVAAVCVGLVLLTQGVFVLSTHSWNLRHPLSPVLNLDSWPKILVNSLWPAAIAAFTVWLAPARKKVHAGALG